MAVTREQLDRTLDALDDSIPAMKSDYPDEGDFWSAFAGFADEAFEQAGEADYAHVSERVDAIMAKHGLPAQP